jgi:transposase
MDFHSIDLHSDSFLDYKLYLDNENKPESKSKKYYLTKDSFEYFKKTLSKDDYVIVEACSNANWFHDQIKDSVKECFVLNVNKYKQNRNKTDKIDCIRLVQELWAFIMFGNKTVDLPLVYVPEVKVRELRSYFSSYKLKNKIKTQLKNRVHSLLKENGYALIIGYDLFKDEVELLISIKGFSAFTAIAVMSDVVDINRFPSVKKFCAYLRTAPQVKSSNKSTKIGKVNKSARTLSCTILTQSIIHFSASSEHMQDFYDRVKIGKKPGVYRMAMIRKILVSAYYMLKRKRKFHWVDNELYDKKIITLKRQIKKTA